MVIQNRCVYSRDGSVRVYSRTDRRKSSGGSEAEVEYRAAYHQYGWKQKRVWGKWCTSIGRTIAGLLPKLKSKKETNDALWAETIKEAAGYVYAASRNNTAGYQPQVANEELPVGSCIFPPLLLCTYT